MRRWSQLATRNWLAKPSRTLGAVAAIALGTGSVVWVTACYESVRRQVAEFAADYIGRSQINVESVLGKHNPFTERSRKSVEALPEVKHVVAELTYPLSGNLVSKQAWTAARDAFVDWNTNLPVFELQGIEPENEKHVRDHDIVAGRMLTPDDRHAAILERGFAEDADLGVGSILLVWNYEQETPHVLEVVGLLDRRRVAKFQKPLVLLPLKTLQRISGKFRMITSMDLILVEEDSVGEVPKADAPVPDNPDRQYLSRVAGKVQREMRRFGVQPNIRDAGARIRQIENAQSQQELVMVLLSSVAMLTSLFIILSTLSMGMIERVGQLGLMRCVGMTRWQLAKLIVYEVVPLGLFGIILGIPIGLALTWVTMMLVPDYFGQFVLSRFGIVIASIGGFFTTLLAAFIPAVAATTVTPLEASRPRARNTGKFGVVIALFAALILLAAQKWVIDNRAHRSVAFTYWASTSIVLLYLFYALIAPACIWLASRPVVSVVATALGLRGKMLQDQVGSALWRSTGICCGLMVGLSLIVALTVFSNSFRAGWDFPKKFPEAYMWSFEQIDNSKLKQIAEIEGISEYTIANARNAITVEMPAIGPQLVRSITWFLGCDPDTFLDLVRLEFKEGDRDEAIEKLKQGGHILVAADFARTRNKHLNDKVKVWIGQIMHEFTVAGVVDSPALDVASSYFQAQSEMRVVAVGSVIGTNKDLERLWRINAFNMVLLNFDLEYSEPPADWPPPRNSPEARRMPFWVFDESDSVASRWKSYQERLVLDEMKAELQTSAAFVGTVSELKEKIDDNLTRLTLLLSAVPGVALIVAALGVANLMTANITSRAKQIAMMRAVGATRGQILRLVIGEALVLGILGCILGLALGLHLSYNTKIMTQRMWGFDIGVHVPWLEVGAAVILTVGLCLIAGLLPARHASRSNVIDALHVA